MRMIELLSVMPESVELAMRSASPMAVPESHGRSWRMDAGVILDIMALIPLVSLENGNDIIGLPANTIMPNISLSLSLRNVLIVSFADSIRLGDISSASMERDISRTMRILCFSLSRYSHVWYFPTHITIPTRDVIIL
jgi:hypothetical protein